MNFGALDEATAATLSFAIWDFYNKGKNAAESTKIIMYAGTGKTWWVSTPSNDQPKRVEVLNQKLMEIEASCQRSRDGADYRYEEPIPQPFWATHFFCFVSFSLTPVQSPVAVRINL